MKLNAAIQSLSPQRWANTRPLERLRLLEQLRENMLRYQDELTLADVRMKNRLIGADEVTVAQSGGATLLPIANTITSLIALYEGLAHGQLPAAVETKALPGDRTDLLVFPRTALDKAMNMDSKGWLRVKGPPTQVNPYDRPVQIIGVLGAGNFSSSIEMVRGMFVANGAVLHKPHHNHVESDKVWEKIFAPLVDIGAVAFSTATRAAPSPQTNASTRSTSRGA